MLSGKRGRSNGSEAQDRAAIEQLRPAPRTLLAAAALAVSTVIFVAACIHAMRREAPSAPARRAPGSPEAPAARQAAPWYVSYTLRLNPGAGAEQSVTVLAPPGGLQLAVRDMTGDKIQNDLVVTPALLQWPLTVLVNDGNNHFTVAISAKPPDSSASNRDCVYRTNEFGDKAALVSRGFGKHAAGNRGGIGPLAMPEGPHRFKAPAAMPLSGLAFRSGRAPPALATAI